MSVRRKEDIELFHEHGIYVPKRHIILMGELEEANIREAITNLTMLNLTSHDPITILINTPGGSVYDGFALYDTIKACDSP